MKRICSWEKRHGLRNAQTEWGWKPIELHFRLDCTVRNVQENTLTLAFELNNYAGMQYIYAMMQDCKWCNGFARTVASELKALYGKVFEETGNEIFGWSNMHYNGCCFCLFLSCDRVKMGEFVQEGLQNVLNASNGSSPPAKCACVRRASLFSGSVHNLFQSRSGRESSRVKVTFFYYKKSTDKRSGGRGTPPRP